MRFKISQMRVDKYVNFVLLVEFSSFPVIHKVGNVGICTTSNENKLEVVANEINVNANLHLSWCFKLKVMGLITMPI